LIKVSPQSGPQFGEVRSREWGFLPMLAVAKFLPAATRFLRQIVPPVIATLIAAVLIQGYNRAFTGHLAQPRMGGLTEAATTAPEPAPSGASVVAKAPAAPATEYITIYERAEPDRLADKDDGREAGKEQAAIRVAPARAAAARPARVPALAAAPTVPVTTSIAVAPVAAEPPPVIVAAPPQTYALVPQGAQEQPVIEAPPAPRRGALGAIANALSPSALLSRAREFGEKIEATGNEILPNIRP
jgi:hypothetical protein